jgi:hypothetical protein
MDTAVVVILEPNTGSTRRVQLPLQPRPFDRRVVADYRNSLLSRVPRGSSNADRISAVFDDKAFPAPENAMLIADTRPVGDHVWIQEASPRGAAHARWYVVDPVAARLLAQVNVPANWQVLGGCATDLFVLHRDELDVEYVGVHQLIRN